MKSLQLTFNCFQFTESFTRKGRKSIALKSKSSSPSISMCHIILVCQCKQLPRASRRWHRRAIPLPGLLLHYNLAHKESRKEKGGWRLVSSPSHYQGNVGQVMFVRAGIPKSIDFWELISVSMASKILTCFRWCAGPGNCCYFCDSTTSTIKQEEA